MNRRDILLGAVAAAAAACSPAASVTPPPPFPIRRGVNLGNALEAPTEGEWGYTIEDKHLDVIAEAGFDGVRLPVRWDLRTGARAPFAIEPALMARVDHVVTQCLTRGLKVQLDLHHYADLYDNPDWEIPRYRAIWRQIATHFADAPPDLIFEPLNEPRGELWTGERVTQSQIAALEEIRVTNPTRTVVLGGPNWNSIDGLADWTPPQDPHLVATAHYYEPHDFTHQGATWENPPPTWDGLWGTPEHRREIERHIGIAARWGREHGLAMQIGEFGVIEQVSDAQRALWVRVVRETCEANGVGWCVWDWAGAFPVFHPLSGDFLPEMRAALFG